MKRDMYKLKRISSSRKRRTLQPIHGRQQMFP